VSALRLEVEQLQTMQAAASTKSTKLESELSESRGRLDSRMTAADERAQLAEDRTLEMLRVVEEASAGKVGIPSPLSLSLSLCYSLAVGTHGTRSGVAQRAHRMHEWGLGAALA
jgi:hypothetical protein